MAKLLATQQKVGDVVSCKISPLWPKNACRCANISGWSNSCRLLIRFWWLAKSAANAPRYGEFTFVNEKIPTQRIGNCSCLHCGHQWSMPAEWNFYSTGTLWLTIRCHKNVLWILNRPHLDFMEQFIAADLREERMPEMSSRRLSSALPRWLISGKNRDDVVRYLKEAAGKAGSNETGLISLAVLRGIPGNIAVAATHRSLSS